MQHPTTYDVIVVGGGHAGTEACLAAARAGARTLLLTQNIETLGQMSCNPAIGGIGKSHLVREIDALGGAMAHAADRAGIQFRTLNSRKGPAVRATRAQADRALYRAAIRDIVEHQPNLALFQQSVDDLIVENGRVVGVVTAMGLGFRCRAVVLTVGTFLGGVIHVGLEQSQGGRAGDAPSNRLAARLRELPFRVDRLKTGTPPRIDARSVDFTDLEAQPGDEPTPVMSFMGRRDEHPLQVSCHITHTNERTHEIIRAGLDRSPMYTGVIDGVGPRYCPSIEDKVVRFADRSGHQVFIEPEGLHSTELYPNGISTSLPFDVQMDLVRSIKGFEAADITRPGYAIEYDFFDPRDLSATLETKHMPGLWFAGQINGTTGYEEAGAQGIVAGINAARACRDEAPWRPERTNSYIGVMIDDLVTQGTKEPYRMFTSRAEYRLTLRQDNADVRLTPIGRELGVVDDVRWARYCTKQERIDVRRGLLGRTFVQPGSEEAALLEPLLDRPLAREYSVADLLRRPQLGARDVLMATGLDSDDTEVDEQLEIELKYAGYIDRQHQEIARLEQEGARAIPTDLDYASIRGLSNEVVQKLNDTRPETIAQAHRIPGVTPAAVSLLLIYLKKRGVLGAAREASGSA